MDILTENFCAEEGFYFEPLLTLLIHFTRFMEAYQAAEDKDEDK